MNAHEAAVVQSLIHFMAAIYSKAEMADITQAAYGDGRVASYSCAGRAGDYAAAIAPYDEAIVRFGDSDAPGDAG